MMSRVTLAASIVALLSALPTTHQTTNQDTVTPAAIPVAAARSRIQIHDDLIARRYQEMNGRYAYGAAERTLKVLFQHKGITSSLGYTSSWGNNGLWLAWEPAQIFYRYHRDVLAQSLKTFSEQPKVNGKGLVYLDAGMQLWREHEHQLDLLFQQTVDVYLKRAVNFDRKFTMQDKYRRLRAEAFAAKAYDRLTILNTEEARELSPITREANQLDETLASLRRDIDETSRKRLFEAITSTLEPEVRSGRASGANDGETP